MDLSAFYSVLFKGVSRIQDQSRMLLDKPVVITRMVSEQEDKVHFTQELFGESC